MAGEERVGLEEEKGCEGTGGVGLEKGKGWRKRGVWLEEGRVCERAGLEEVRGCGWGREGCGWRKRRVGGREGV